MLQVDFAESHKVEHRNAIQSAYFGNQCFNISSTVNLIKICTYGVMEWGLNSGSVGRVPRMVSEGP